MFPALYVADGSHRSRTSFGQYTQPRRLEEVAFAWWRSKRTTVFLRRMAERMTMGQRLSELWDQPFSLRRDEEKHLGLAQAPDERAWFGSLFYKVELKHLNDNQGVDAINAYISFGQ